MNDDGTLNKKLNWKIKYLNNVIQRNTLTILTNVPTIHILYIFYRWNFTKTRMRESQKKPKKNKDSITSRRKSRDSRILQQ